MHFIHWILVNAGNKLTGKNTTFKITIITLELARRSSARRGEGAT